MSDRRIGDVEEKIVDGDGIFDNTEILGYFGDVKTLDFKDLHCKDCDNNLFIFQINNKYEVIKIICSKCDKDIELFLCIGCNEDENN